MTNKTPPAGAAGYRWVLGQLVGGDEYSRTVYIRAVEGRGPGASQGPKARDKESRRAYGFLQVSYKLVLYRWKNFTLQNITTLWTMQNSSSHFVK